MAKAGDYTGADDLISSRAKGLAATIRSGEMNNAKIESLKTTFDGLELFNRKNANGGLQFVLKNKSGQLLQFVIIKEGPDFVIRDFVVRDAK